MLMYLYNRQTKKITQLEIKKSAYEERDKIEKIAREKQNKIDARLPDRIMHKRKRVLDDLQASSKSAANVSKSRKRTK